VRTAGASCGVFFALASSVIIVAARAGLLPPCVIPALEMPPAQIDRIVQEVYFALKRRGLDAREASRMIPLFHPTRAKTRENGAFYGSRAAENAGKSMGFRDSERQTGI